MMKKLRIASFIVFLSVCAFGAQRHVLASGWPCEDLGCGGTSFECGSSGGWYSCGGCPGGECSEFNDRCTEYCGAAGIADVHCNPDVYCLCNDNECYLD